MKLQRWVVFDYLLNKGEWCTSKDVAELEAKCAELEASHSELLKALEFAVASWSWYMTEMDMIDKTPYAKMEWVDIAKKAIKQAKGQQP